MKKLLLTLALMLGSAAVHAGDILGTFMCPSGLVFFTQTSGMINITVSNFRSGQTEMYTFNGGISRIVLPGGKVGTTYTAYNSIGQIAIVGTSESLLRDNMVSFNATNFPPEYCTITGSVRG